MNFEDQPCSWPSKELLFGAAAAREKGAMNVPKRAAPPSPRRCSSRLRMDALTGDHAGSFDWHFRSPAGASAQKLPDCLASKVAFNPASLPVGCGWGAVSGSRPISGSQSSCEGEVSCVPAGGILRPSAARVGGGWRCTEGYHKD